MQNWWKRHRHKCSIIGACLGGVGITAITSITTVACADDQTSNAQSLAIALADVNKYTVTGGCIPLTVPNKLALTKNTTIQSLTLADQTTIDEAFQNWLKTARSLQNIAFLKIFNRSSGVVFTDATIAWEQATVKVINVAINGQQESQPFVVAPIVITTSSGAKTISTTSLNFTWGGAFGNEKGTINQANHFYNILLIVSTLFGNGIPLPDVGDIPLGSGTTLSQLTAKMPGSTETYEEAIDVAFQTEIVYLGTYFSPTVMDNTLPSQYTLTWSTAKFGNRSTGGGYIIATVTYTAQNGTAYAIPLETENILTKKTEINTVNFYGFASQKTNSTPTNPKSANPTTPKNTK